MGRELVRIGVQATGLKELGRDVRAGDAVLKKGFKAALKTGADVVGEEYERRIRQFSSRIPSSIKTGSTPTSAYVKAGGSRAPHAAAFENMGRAGSFRHPVFGNDDVWVTQLAHPAAVPALQAEAGTALRAVDKAIAEWAKSLGFD